MLKALQGNQPATASWLTATAPYLLYGMVFTGAFLLFIMEPLVGRLLTPFFGGAVHVWLTSMMFFQGMLLAGYLYSYLFARRFGRWHLLILLLPLINLPLKIACEYAPEMPILSLLSVLLTYISLPFWVLATTAIVAQVWLAHSDLAQASNPYPLYAASNAGSLIALLGYPFLVEPFLGLRVQSLLWTAGYIIYLFLVVLTWQGLRPDLTTGHQSLNNQVETAQISTPQVCDYCWWLWLSFLPSGFLLAVTNVIAQEIGSFPLIWIAPLSLYLGSFIITFRAAGGVPKIFLNVWPLILLLGIILYLLPIIKWFQFVVCLFVFFSICLYAHGELYERRPPVGSLTNFYLTIAVGGWFGGIFVALIAPQIFSGLFEYPLLYLFLALTVARTQGGRFFSAWRHMGTVVRIAMVATAALLTATLLLILKENFKNRAQRVAAHRSFYGIYKVIDLPSCDDAPKGFRSLSHGQTRHGGEYLDPEQRGQITTYYHPGGAISDVFGLLKSPCNVGVVGLGTGTVAAFTKATDTITFFEIDPANEMIARSYFSYLNHAKGTVRIVTGDGRLSLAAAAKTSPKFDLIVVDAFSGDGIPTHLLTREAIQIYLDSLAEDGVLLLHISNRYYELRPVLKAVAQELHLSGLMSTNLGRTNLKKYDVNPTCVVLAKGPGPIQPLLNQGWIAFGADDGLKSAAPWSDDYINILEPLRKKIFGPDATSSK